MAANPTPATSPRRDFIVLLICLLVVIGALFHKSFLPDWIVFNNDNPLGNIACAAQKLPEGFTGGWGANWVWLGLDGGSTPTDLSMLALWLGGPVMYAKFWQPFSLVFLGLCAWVFCRSLKFSTAACVLTGLAAAIHSDFFSNACWGQVSRPMALGTMFLALAAAHQSNDGWRGWLKVAAAGLAIGWGVMEGFDIAALFSVVAGAYVVYHSWATSEGNGFKGVLLGGVKLVIIAGLAACLAAQALTSLIGSNITGTVGTAQDAETKRQKWDWATQWSLPKTETLSVIAPGLFGFRMDSPDGGQYWGAIGRDPAWDRYYESDMTGQPPRGILRMGGGGGGGVLIQVAVLWALLQTFRRKDSPFSATQQRLIWFWAALAAGSLLLAWGRFAPFYQFFYMLPYASTIRNPAKFMHLFDWAELVIFAFSIHALSRQLLPNPTAAGRTLGDQWKFWRNNSSIFDRRWFIGSVAVISAAALAWMIYGSSSTELKKYLIKYQFDPASAAAIAKFSLRQAGWAVLFITTAIIAWLLVLTGYFNGKRAKWGIALLGAVLVADLGRANLPWIIHWDYQQKYATNPIIERLRENAHEQRVTIMPEWVLGAFQVNDQAQNLEQYLNQLYRIEWTQHLFLYYNIHSLDIIQLPRQPVDYVAYETALQVRSGDTLRLQTRKWELTNTRYVLAGTAFVDLLNKQFDPGRERFHVGPTFNIIPKPGVTRVTKLEELTAESATNGMYALIEFTGALPRAKLYTHWQISTNDDATLQTLTSTTFDPAQTVLVAETIAAPATTNQTAGDVKITNYTAKRVELEAKADAPAILLLNDRTDSKWHVYVDDKEEKLLRCNYLMRGVQLTPGQHRVRFEFQPPLKPLQLTLATTAFGAVLLLVIFFTRRRPTGEPAQTNNH